MAMKQTGLNGYQTQLLALIYYKPSLTAVVFIFF